MSDFDLLQKDIEYIKDSVKDLKDDLRSRFVTQDQFKPVKLIVFGMAGIILAQFIKDLL